MAIVADNAQHQGNRKEQQDAFGFSDMNSLDTVHSGVLSVVADGMGGMAMGKECAEMAVATFIEAYAAKCEDESIPHALERSLMSANKAVYDLAASAGFAEEAGCTLIAATIHKRLLYWVSVGDSHIYLYGGNKLTQINTDHNLRNRLNLLVAKGKITPSEIEGHANLDALTSYVGIKELIEIDLVSQPIILHTGDSVVLCSDGLYKTIDEEKIRKILSENAYGAANVLVKATLHQNNPYQDNVTVSILSYTGEAQTVLIPNRDSEFGKTGNADKVGFFSKLFRNTFGKGKLQVSDAGEELYAE